MIKELKGIYDANEDIHFHHIFKWMLPKFGDGKQTFYECLAARMLN
jgi:hypothetical protein